MAQKILDYCAKVDDIALFQVLENAPIMMHSIDTNGIIVQVSQFWAAALSRF